MESGSRVSSSSVSEWEGSDGELVGEGSRSLGRNQRGLQVGCCAMVGGYYDDSSVEENLNLLLRLARVETNVDSKPQRTRGFFKGVLQGTRMLGTSTAAPGNERLHGVSRARVFKEARTQK